MRPIMLGLIAALVFGIGTNTAFAKQTPPGISGGTPNTTSRLERATAKEPGHSVQANGGVVVLDFEGLQNLEPVGEYYNAGVGGFGSGPGPAMGISFSANALSIIDSDAAGGTGNFGGEPSPDTVLFFLSGAATTLNVAGGFSTGFSFFYSAINVPASIVVYDGLDGTGNVLANLALPITPSDGGDPTGPFSPFVPIGVSFAGTAMSVDFGGTEDQVGFDNITLGSTTPVRQAEAPIPTLNWWAIVALSLLLLSIAVIRLRRSA